MYDNTALSKLTTYKLSKLFDELTITTSLNLLNVIQLYLIDNDIWVRNKDVIVFANLNNTITFALVTDDRNLLITVDRDNLIYLQNNDEVFDELHNLLNWVYETTTN